VGGTPDWLKEKIVAYYQETTEKSYLPNWSTGALSLHYGLADETTASHEEAHNNNNRYLSDALGVREGMRVLDAGCGVGGTSIWMARERRAQMVGVTLDPNQVRLGTAFARERGVADLVRLEVMDFAATTFPGASFDAAFNLDSLCHAADARAYFEHLCFLLKDGAAYAAMDFFVGEGHPDLVRETMEGWPMPNWLPVAAVAMALEQAGFVEVRVVDLTGQVRRSAEQLISMASNTRLVMQLDRAMGHTESPVYEGHVRGGVACSQGLLNGGVTYACVTARRPPR
jgi:SAM-dependent methyltransferase